MPNELRIFEIRYTASGEKEWVCAYTNIQALQLHMMYCGLSFYDYDSNDEIVEIPRDQWANFNIRNDDWDEESADWQTKTFEEYMIGKTEPDIITGTMY